MSDERQMMAANRAFIEDMCEHGVVHEYGNDCDVSPKCEPLPSKPCECWPGGSPHARGVSHCRWSDDGSGRYEIPPQEPPVTQDDESVTIAARDERYCHACGAAHAGNVFGSFGAVPADVALGEAEVGAAPFGLSLDEGLAQMETVAVEYLAEKMLAANWVKWDLRDTVGGYPLGTTMTIAQREIIHNALRYYALKDQHKADARIAAVVREPSDEEAPMIGAAAMTGNAASGLRYGPDSATAQAGRDACAAIVALAQARAEKPR